MKKILIIILLFVFFVNFISASGCRIHEDDLKIVVGVYDKIQDENKFVFEESRFQPNDDKKIVQVDDVLIIESFNIKIDSNCNLIDKVKENGINIAFIRPNETYLSESISITLDRVDFQEKNGFFEYSFNITNITHLETKEGLDYFLEYLDLNGNFFGLDYVPLNKVGEWEIIATDNDGGGYRKNIFNEGGYFRKINVLNRIDVAQLEALEQLKEDSNESATHAIKVAWWAIGIAVLIGISTIIFMWLFHKREEKRIFKQEEEKQIDLLKTLLTELIFLEGNLNSYKETFSRQNVYPFYELWNIDVSLYLKNLNHKVQNKETISLKKELMIIKDKLFIINNMKIETKKLEEERGQEKIIKEVGVIKMNREQIVKIIDETIGKVEKLKKFIEEKFDIKPKR